MTTNENYGLDNLEFVFETAKRESTHLKMGIAGIAGSGKTYSAILIALGLGYEPEQIAIIDTENRSASLYSHLGVEFLKKKNISNPERNFKITRLAAPFHPNRYKAAIESAINSGFKVLIIDSLSHEWNGEGGVLDIVKETELTSKEKTTKEKNQEGWREASYVHNELLNMIINAPIHIICTLRSKIKYIWDEETKITEKVGTSAVQKEGLEYEFTIYGELTAGHIFQPTKDRTGLFIKGSKRNRFIPSVNTGRTIRQWFDSGIDTTVKTDADPKVEPEHDEVIVDQLKKEEMVVVLTGDAEIVGNSSIADAVSVEADKNGNKEEIILSFEQQVELTAGTAIKIKGTKIDEEGLTKQFNVVSFEVIDVVSSEVINTLDEPKLKDTAPKKQPKTVPAEGDTKVGQTINIVCLTDAKWHDLYQDKQKVRVCFVKATLPSGQQATLMGEELQFVKKDDQIEVVVEKDNGLGKDKNPIFNVKKAAS